MVILIFGVLRLFDFICGCVCLWFCNWDGVGCKEFLIWDGFGCSVSVLIIFYMEGVMVYEECNVWVGFIVSLIVMVVYVMLVL